VSEITLSNSLQGFFFDELLLMNETQKLPLHNEILFYVSQMMDHFMESKHFFEMADGRVSEKVLGVKLLESSNLSGTVKQKELQDIGDTALCLSGFFNQALEKKLVGPQYYYDIGISAYEQLNGLVPNLLHVDDFYKILSIKFKELAEYLTFLAHKFFDVNKLKAEQEEQFLIFSSHKLKAS